MVATDTLVLVKDIMAALNIYGAAVSKFVGKGLFLDSGADRVINYCE